MAEIQQPPGNENINSEKVQSIVDSSSSMSSNDSPIHDPQTPKTILRDNSTGSLVKPEPLPSDDLPEELLQIGWRKYWSKRENMPYYFNKITKESLWEMPQILHQKRKPQNENEGDSSKKQKLDKTNVHRVLENVKRHVNSCSTLISDLISMLDSQQDLKDNPRVSDWRLEIEEIEKKLKMPKTVIAVVGDTGSGKSSLMNALLDDKNVLPTSSMKACTAVVVEVVENTFNDQMEADIVFLQKEEWFDELQNLLNDLTGLDGTLKNRIPDSQSDAYASYCKVKAVYGTIDKFEKLESQTTVTQWLGQTKVIQSTDLEAFRCEIETYIETQEPGSGGQYWPIVKRVQLRVPNCDVCSSGAVLVDLPGIRDSNAARDLIAKEFLKNCTSVWVVSAIHRAIDDKTAKELLGESFRRQLLMDGMYGSISFICTKTDDLKPSEIIRNLKLSKETHMHYQQINEIQLQKAGLCIDVDSEKIHKLEQQLDVHHKEIRLICAKARNEYSKSQLKLDFKAGLKEMKKYSGMQQDVDEEDEDDSIEDDSNIVDNLQVFCCSALEYQKLKNPLTVDGPAQVFSNFEDTQIPKLVDYVHEIASVKRQQAMERLIRSLGSFLFTVQMYLSDNSSSNSNSYSTKAIDDKLAKLEVSLALVLQQMASDIEQLFEKDIREKIQEGASNAAAKAHQTCAKWGSCIQMATREPVVYPLKHIRPLAEEKGFSGRRHMNFNEELTEPMYQSMLIVWDQAFKCCDSGKIWQILDKVKNEILDKLKEFTMALGVQLEAFGIERNQSTTVSAQAILSASNKLGEMVIDLRKKIIYKQRDINRIVTFHIQNRLMDIYHLCSLESGKGMFERMKNCMQQGVDSRCRTMFNEVVMKLMKDLIDLREEVLQDVGKVHHILINDLRVAFEPLGHAVPTLRSAFHTSIATACVKVREIYDAAGLENREELALGSLSEEITPGSTTAVQNTQLEQ